jgi:phage-related protein
MSLRGEVFIFLQLVAVCGVLLVSSQVTEETSCYDFTFDNCHYDPDKIIDGFDSDSIADCQDACAKQER